VWSPIKKRKVIINQLAKAIQRLLYWGFLLRKKLSPIPLRVSISQLENCPVTSPNPIGGVALFERPGHVTGLFIVSNNVNISLDFLKNKLYNNYIVTPLE